MLNFMRKNAGTWLVKILLGAIVLVFVFWGVGSFRSSREARVALINGEPITIEEYNQTYNRILEQARQQYGTALNDEILKMMQINKQAMDQLIEKRLLLSEANRLNFRVSDEELAKIIYKIAAFHDNGVFDSKKYKAVLAQNRLTPESFEIMQRENVLVEKLGVLVAGSIKVSDQEIEEWYQWENAQVRIEHVLFDPSQISGVNISEDELKAYFENNKNSYKTEQKLNTSYIQFIPGDYVSKVSLTDSEIKEYYDSNPREFFVPKSVEVSHVLIHTLPDAGQEIVEKAREKAVLVMNLAKEGKDFAVLAKQYSDDPGKDNGGRLGAFKKNELIEPFSEKAFSMNPGEISDPVRTQFGWHIIKMDKVNEAGIIPLDRARPSIVKKITEEKARNLAYEEASVVYSAALDSDSLIKAAETLNLKIEKPEPFGRSGPAAGMKNPSKFASVAFKLSPKAISDIVDFGDAYYIIQVNETIAEAIPDYSQVAARVKADLTKQKQDELALMNARQLLSDLKKATVKDEEKKGIFIQTGFFKRSDRIPDIGFENEISSVAFKLSEGKKYPDDPVKGLKGYYVIRFKERKAADSLGLSGERDQIKSMLTSKKQRKAFEDLLASLRNNAKIVIEESYR